MGDFLRYMRKYAKKGIIGTNKLLLHYSLSSFYSISFSASNNSKNTEGSSLNHKQ